MQKRFNIAGTCIPEKHYMADTSDKIEKIIRMIEQDSYFTIDRARQYGKTTTLLLLWRRLKDRYVVISISFEGLGADAFRTEDGFVRSFCRRVQNSLRLAGYPSKLQEAWTVSKEKEDLDTLRYRIIDFCETSEKEVLLFIDEVDKSSDAQLFLDLLSMLRELYLERAMGAVTFKSVVLASVYDVKNLKRKLRGDEERKYNSPWNVAVDFFIDMSLSVTEIAVMLKEYQDSHGLLLDIQALSEEIYHYTSGYPFLVSLICLWLDERAGDVMPYERRWTIEGIRWAVRSILKSTNTLFDDVVKNIENYPRFRELIEGILLQGNQVPYKLSNPEIDLGVTFGIISEEDGLCKISNIIFETYIYDHLVAARTITRQVLSTPRTQFLDGDGNLAMDVVLAKFQELMKSEYRKEDDAFLERQGKLLFLAFLKPIINGTGHYVVEPQTRNNTRMDVVVFYGDREYIVELKIWHGPKRAEEALWQLADYMESRGQRKGWLLTFCFLEGYEKRIEDYTRTVEMVDGKEICSVVV